MSFFNKEKLKQLAADAKAAGTRLGVQVQQQVQTAQQTVQQQMQQQVTRTQSGHPASGRAPRICWVLHIAWDASGRTAWLAAVPKV